MRFLLLLLPLLLFQDTTSAQVPFGPVQYLSELSDLKHPTAVWMVDHNGDGHVDILVSDLSGVGAYHGDGGGEFGTFTRMVTLSRSSVAVGDIDQDGLPDIVSAELETGSIRVWLNRVGEVPSAQTVDQVDEPWIHDLLDLDADGDLDLLTSRPDNMVVWYVNDGSGLFSPEESRTIGTFPGPSYSYYNDESFQLADLNGDGVNDLLATKPGFSGWTGWFEADDHGVFGDWHETPLRLGGVSCGATDVDLDGALDFVCSEGSYVDTFWLRNQGDGTFGGPTAAWAWDHGVDSERVLLATDVDGDGIEDMISAWGEEWLPRFKVENENVGWYRNDGRGSFEERRILSHGFRALDLKAADVNHDGLLDVAIPYSFENRLAVSLQQADGTWIETDLTRSTTPAVSALRLADLDQDGDLDVVLGSDFFAWDRISWLRNDGPGGFSAPMQITSAVSGPLEVADLNDDGFADIVAARNRTVAWIRGLGGGGFLAAYPLDQPPNPVSGGFRSLLAQDWNGDGSEDVLGVGDRWGSNGIRGTLHLWVNLGDGELAAPTSTDLLNESLSYSVALDYDRDGDLDVAGVLENSNGNSRLALLENIRRGGFVDPVAVTGWTRGWRSLLAADMDGDGDEDLVASPTGTYITWYENQGSPAWPMHSTRVEGVPGHATDIDADGDVDVVYMDGTEGALHVLLNDGEGQFTSEKLADEPFGWYAQLLSPDLDGDGDADLIWSTGDEVVWMENLTTGVANDHVPAQASQWELYPNPFSDWIVIRSPLVQATPVTWQLFDLLGRAVQAGEEYTRDGGRLEIKMDDLAAGPYVLRITSGQHQLSRVVIRER